MSARQHPPSRDVAEPNSSAANHSNPLSAGSGKTAQVVLNRAARQERRRAARHSCQLQTACVVISLVEPVLLAVRVRDISQTGIGLVLPNRLQPGTFLAVKLQGPKQQAPRVLRAQVIHATVQADRRSWLLGCSFVGELRKEDLALLV
ncbi:MAG: PilZ domain-containing protein [Gemmataceae bacterium]|nr:PilZ domain-containing protein [Gemmataceae bacterium]